MPTSYMLNPFLFWLIGSQRRPVRLAWLCCEWLPHIRKDPKSPEGEDSKTPLTISFGHIGAEQLQAYTEHLILGQGAQGQTIPRVSGRNWLYRLLSGLAIGWKLLWLTIFGEWAPGAVRAGWFFLELLSANCRCLWHDPNAAWLVPPFLFGHVTNTMIILHWSHSLQKVYYNTRITFGKEGMKKQLQCLCSFIQVHEVT